MVRNRDDPNERRTKKSDRSRVPDVRRWQVQAGFCGAARGAALVPSAPFSLPPDGCGGGGLPGAVLLLVGPRARRRVPAFIPRSFDDQGIDGGGGVGMTRRCRPPRTPPYPDQRSPVAGADVPPLVPRWSQLPRSGASAVLPAPPPPPLLAPAFRQPSLPSLREKPGGKPASPNRNRHTRLTIPVFWHPLGIDCRAGSDVGVGWGRGRRKQHGREGSGRGA